MLPFHAPTLEDKPWVDEVLQGSRHMGCLYTFAQVYLWSPVYKSTICRFKNCLLIRSCGENPYYIYPGGSYDIREVVEALSADAGERGDELRFVCVEEWQRDELFAAFPQQFTATESRADFDYIYLAEDLISLSGKKYHGKRNHISKFSRANPDWTYEPISAENSAQCACMEKTWQKENSGDDELISEAKIIAKALREMDALGLSGGLIRTGGRVVAFTLGEPLCESNNSFVLHFEKALAEFSEAYTVINREFAAHNLRDYKYINREEDLDIEGLRMAKLSYRPAILLKKYEIRRVG